MQQNRHTGQTAQQKQNQSQQQHKAVSKQVTSTGPKTLSGSLLPADLLTTGDQTTILNRSGKPNCQHSLSSQKAGTRERPPECNTRSVRFNLLTGCAVQTLRTIPRFAGPLPGRTGRIRAILRFNSTECGLGLTRQRLEFMVSAEENRLFCQNRTSLAGTKTSSHPVCETSQTPESQYRNPRHEVSSYLVRRHRNGDCRLSG